MIKRPIFDAEDENSIGYYQAIVLDPNPKAVCQLLALAVEHVDTLLEDWYPSLGTRFLHTSEGKMLVTRLVPCPRCLTSHNERESTKSWQDWSFLKKLQPQQQQQQQPPRPSEVLRVSQDSGMGQESPRGSQNAPPTEEASETVLDEHVYAFMVEECKFEYDILFRETNFWNFLIFFPMKTISRTFLNIFFLPNRYTFSL